MAEVWQNLVGNSIRVVGGEWSISLARNSRGGRQDYNRDILTKPEHR